MNARVLAAAALLLGSAAARAQLTCTPNRLLAGAEIRIGSPGAFGGSPSAEVVLTYRRAAVGSPVGFGAPRSWSAREVAFLLPAGLADGVYEVALSSPAGALRNPSCFTIGPPLVMAPLAPRTVGVGIAHTLDMVVDGDLPCDGDTKMTLWGKNFQLGTEATGLAPGGWAAGKTAIEIASGGRPYPPVTRTPSPPRLVIRDPGTIEFTISRCILLYPGLKLRVWFPDGTKSEWRYPKTEWDHDGTGSPSPGVLTLH